MPKLHVGGKFTKGIHTKKLIPFFLLLLSFEARQSEQNQASIKRGKTTQNFNLL